MKAELTFTIKQAADTIRISEDTIRYYERRGLLAKPLRNQAGYRKFPEGSVPRLRFIKRAQLLGFSLTEIKELLALQVAPGSGCADVRHRAQAKIGDIEEKIRSLDAMKRALRRLVSECTADGPANKCSFLTNLSVESPK